MASRCASPIKGRTIRVVKLTDCGVPVTGAASAQVVSDGFVSINYSPQYEEGQEFLLKKANGSLCVNDKDPNELKRWALTINLCSIDFDMVALMTGERLLTTSVGATGAGVAFGEGPLIARFSLEVWQNVSGAGACNAAGLPQYVYWALPNVGNAKLGNYDIANAPSQLVIEAETKAASPLWGDGPGSVSWLDGNVLMPDEHMAPFITTVAPPTPTCGAVLLS